MNVKAWVAGVVALVATVGVALAGSPAQTRGRWRRRGRRWTSRRRGVWRTGWRR